jgi:hypothetical protein
LKGWQYEKRGSLALIEEFGITRYIPSQWFQYSYANNQIKFCQTDGLLFTPEEQKVLIIEFKYKHTDRAYYQFEEKYVPVVNRLFPKWTVATCEICKWYDPDTPFPVEVKLKKDITQTRPNEFGVHINSF